MNIKLLPCPFCGGKGVLEGDGDCDLSYHVSRAWIKCSECDSESSEISNLLFDQKSSEECIQKAADKWNTRSHK